MFIGTHYHKLDEKSRVSVPKPFRSDLAHGSVIT
ncbi:cell division/cell wall cluster transcriptional repressor MraZ, partial [Candidatus Bathyarchaeota archaeon]|nr:cell division/cell wall cluster transcriptional repressor MraZ [Candidatus Bathyarchaeota archaeon]